MSNSAPGAAMTKFEEVSRALHACLSFMTRWGYARLPDEWAHSTLLGDQLVIRYVSSAADRELRIHFSPATPTHADRLSVFVDSDKRHGFFVNGHLAKRDGQDVASPLINADPERAITVFCRDAASCLQREFETTLADLIQGRAWDAPPFDWAPYK